MPTSSWNRVYGLWDDHLKELLPTVADGSWIHLFTMEAPPGSEEMAPDIVDWWPTKQVPERREELKAKGTKADFVLSAYFYPHSYEGIVRFAAARELAAILCDVNERRNPHQLAATFLKAALHDLHARPSWPHELRLARPSYDRVRRCVNDKFNEANVESWYFGRRVLPAASTTDREVKSVKQLIPMLMETLAPSLQNWTAVRITVRGILG